MNTSDFQSTVLQLAVEDHEILSHFTKAISQMFGSQSKTDVKKAAKAIGLLTDKTILRHFNYEERKVFLPILADRPDRKTATRVGQFQDEHKFLLKQIQQLEHLLVKHGLPKDASMLWKALMRFLNNFEHHANKEDAFFHSLLDGTPARRSRTTARPVAKRKAKARPAR